MRIEYVATRHQRDVSDSIGQKLVNARIARAVYEVRDKRAGVSVTDASDVEISPRTGKPKRQYKRRDMRAED